MESFKDGEYEVRTTVVGCWGDFVITYEGKEFNTVLELVEYVGVDYASLVSRVSRGFSVEEAVKRAKEYDAQKFVVFGKEYKTLTRVANAFSINNKTLVKTVESGYEVEEAVKFILSKGVILNKVKYSSIAELAAEYGMQEKLLWSRLSRGWTLEDAVTTPKKEYKRKTRLMYSGKEYTSKMSLCEDYGISSVLVKDVYKRYNLDFMRAFDMLASYLGKLGGERPVVIRRLPYVIYNGIWFDSLMDFAAHCGIGHSTLRYRMQAYGIDDCLEAMSSLMGSVKKRYEYNGSVYDASDLLKVLGSFSMDILYHHPEVRDVTVPRFPSIKFSPTGYCVNTRLGFRKHREEYLNRTKDMVS